MSSQAKSLQTDPVHKCWNLANCGQFTSTTILQTAISSQVPPSTILQTAPIRKNQILQTASYSQISKSCKLLSSYKYRNLANCSGSKVPKSWKLIHKFTSSNILQTVVNSQVPTSCQPLVTSQVPKSCKLLQFTSAISLQTVPIRKCQKLLLRTAANSQVAKACRLLQFPNAKN